LSINDHGTTVGGISAAGRKKVILVTYGDEFIRNEATSLVEAAGYSVSKVVTTKKLTAQEYGLGSGKAEEIRGDAEDLKTQMIVVDGRLSSAQAHNLAKLCHQEVIDRERLILDIFNSRATTAEAKLQVRLAELKYEIPRAREAVRISLKGEQAGFMGMGEYAVDVKFRALKKQMSVVARKLDEAKRRRNLFRASREKVNLPMVSLAGYTSSGKTTLFNKLTSESKEESAKLFTTLTTTTRGFELNYGSESKRILLSDTVGFISRLPTYMIEAFKSTLEELTYADLILLVLDVSNPIEVVEIKYSSCRQTLDELHIDPMKILIVFNKLDITEREKLTTIRSLVDEIPFVEISAKSGEGMRKLRLRIAERIFQVSPNSNLTYKRKLSTRPAKREPLEKSVPSYVYEPLESVEQRPPEQHTD
jgi:GTPase